MTADDDIDRLYGVDPADFTALRTELAAAAKKRGDVDAAKAIAAARRPTTAAWVVNVLVRNDGTARGRLSDLAERLRAAHASMDGGLIRELSTAQRTLIDELVRTAFAATGQSRPTGALRDDVVGTLQAAIADPDVAGRLGRLARAERWSGFGDFGSVSPVGAGPTTPRTVTDPEQVEAAGKRVAAARSDADAAERTHTDAVEVLAQRTAAFRTARRRYEKLLDTLGAAEAALNTADAEHGDSARAAEVAAHALEAAKVLLAEAESEHQRLAARTESSS